MHDALARADRLDRTPRDRGDDGKVGAVLAPDGGDAEQVIAEFVKLGIDVGALALRLQKEGGDSFKKSWRSLLAGIQAKSTQLAGVAAR